MATLVLSRIRVYPLKGAAGFDLEEVVPDALGIPWDRRWMLVDARGGFLSQRIHPRLALIRVSPAGEAGVFTVRAPGLEPLELRPDLSWGEERRVRVHQDHLSALGGPPEAGEWFSRFLGHACELVFFPQDRVRVTDPAWAPGHRVGFADGYPLLLVTEASLEDLNRRSPTPASLLRFRPNLVVRGGDPWQEDEWRVVEMGDARLELVKPCARCSVTTVDQGSGTRGREPLRTLATFRRWEGKTYFGQNGVFTLPGGFRAGDDVRIVERGGQRPPLGSRKV